MTADVRSTQDVHPASSAVPTPALVVGTAAVYYAAAKLGLSMAFIADQVTAVWPPTGIALAAVLVLGPRVWPGILLGAFLANATAAEPLATAAGIAIGNTLEALVGAALLRQVGFRRSLERPRDVVALALLSATLSTAVSATIGTVSLCVGRVQPWSAWGALWWVWWVGDALGALVMAPLLLVWSAPPVIVGRRRRTAEAVALGACVVVGGGVVFMSGIGMQSGGYPLHYMIFPLVAWAALRFGQPATTAVTFAVAGLAIWSTMHGRGPFVMATVNASLVILQLFMAVVAVTALLLGAAITDRDLVERRRREEYRLLEASERRLRHALEAGKMGVWEWNIATGDVWWSDTLEPIHGLAPGRFSGTFAGFQALIHPEDRDQVNAAIARAVDEGSSYDVEFRIVSPDGAPRWMAGQGRAITDAHGRAVAMIGVGRDVTERRRLAAELEDRARQLADADRRKDEFLAMLAHELRNPLAALTTALHLLRMDVSHRERSLQVADRQLRQLVRLVDDLLDVSRITRGKITLRKEPVLLDDLVRRAVETVRPAIDARGHAFTVSLPPETVALEADPARMVQVLGNLLSNAVKYTAPGGSLWLTGERIGDEVVIRVRDSGVGIAADLLPHVFDLFVQGSRSIDRTRGGLGIGLTVVRRLVEMHGGRVDARSPGLGQGSEFLVYLPALPPTYAPAPEQRVRSADTAAVRPLKLLIVEDNQDAAESLAQVLEIWGHEVRLALDGLAALDAAAELEPDVIFSDLGLPGIDGFELARRLREQPAFGRAVLVALSGYGRDDDKRRALEAGFDHHMVKPPDLDALAELIGRVAAGTAAGAARTVH